MARRWPADRPGWRRFAPYLPWTDGTGRTWCGWRRLPLAAPFVFLYLLVSWALFIPLAEPTDGKYSIDPVRLRPFLYHIPDLSQDLPAFFRSAVTAPFLNHDSVQIVYVTILLLLFGVVFEAREGTALTMALFFGTALVGSIFAGILLHLLYPRLLDTPLLRLAWERSWSGGSAGCFGLMGALAARARIPWLLFGLFFLWELNVGFWYLKSYIPAFHLTALVTGLVVMRCVVVPGRKPWPDLGGYGQRVRGMLRR